MTSFTQMHTVRWPIYVCVRLYMIFAKDDEKKTNIIFKILHAHTLNTNDGY